MSSNITFHSKPSKIGILINLAVIAGLAYLFHRWSPAYYFFFAAVVYALLARILRSTISREHRAGMTLVKKQDFSRAISHFKRSEAFFSAHSWVDKFRCITLLSSSGLTYREMALE